MAHLLNITVILLLPKQQEVLMLRRTTCQSKQAAVIGFVIAIALSGIFTLSANGHGGKTHVGETFTAFQALEKASKLYDRLIVSGKLTED